MITHDDVARAQSQLSPSSFPATRNRNRLESMSTRMEGLDEFGPRFHSLEPRFLSEHSKPQQDEAQMEVQALAGVKANPEQEFQQEDSTERA